MTERRVNTLVRDLINKGHIIRIKKGNKNAGSNEYNLRLERFNNDPDIKKYISRGQEIQRSKYKKYTSYKTRKDSSYLIYYTNPYVRKSICHTGVTLNLKKRMN